MPVPAAERGTAPEIVLERYRGRADVAPARWKGPRGTVRPFRAKRPERSDRSASPGPGLAGAALLPIPPRPVQRKEAERGSGSPATSPFRPSGRNNVRTLLRTGRTGARNVPRLPRRPTRGRLARW